MTDEQAMWRVQTAEDPDAFALLVHRWQGPLERLCERMLGDGHRAEDLTQEAFTRLFAHRHRYQCAARVSTFIWRIAMNLCYDELRRVQRRAESPIDSDLDENFPARLDFSSAALSPDDQLVEAERADSVRAALLRLAEPYRAVLVLKHYENLKFREIAEVLGIPEGTVKSRMAEALDRLSRLLRSGNRDKLWWGETPAEPTQGGTGNLPVQSGYQPDCPPLFGGTLPPKAARVAVPPRPTTAPGMKGN